MPFPHGVEAPPPPRRPRSGCKTVARFRTVNASIKKGGSKKRQLRKVQAPTYGLFRALPAYPFWRERRVRWRIEVFRFYLIINKLRKAPTLTGARRTVRSRLVSLQKMI